MADAPTSSPESADAGIQVRVEAELTRLLYRLAGFGLFSNFALALILTGGLLSYFPLRLDLSWLAGVFGVSIARWLLNRAFARQPRSDEEIAVWKHRFVAGAALAGAVWGYGGWTFLHTDALLPRLLVVLIVAGMNAGAARSLASAPGCFRLDHGVLFPDLRPFPFAYGPPPAWRLEPALPPDFR